MRIHGQTRFALCLAVGLALLTAAVYWPVANFDFVNYDDPDYVAENAGVQRGLTTESLAWVFTTIHAEHWSPLVWLSHMLDWEFYGPKAGGHYLTNLLLHIANTLLLFVVLGRLSGAVWRSAIVAALFALQPLHGESVAWISERKDVLSTFFFLLTLWTYGCYARMAGDQASKLGSAKILTRLLSPGPTFYGSALMFFTLGLMSKPMLVTLPLVLLLAAASCVLVLVSENKWGSVSSMSAVPLSFRLPNAVSSYVGYLRETVWPDDLAVFYPYREQQESCRTDSGANNVIQQQRAYRE